MTTQITSHEAESETIQDDGCLNVAVARFGLSTGIDCNGLAYEELGSFDGKP